MKWILVGQLLSASIAQGFDSQEACEDKASVLRRANADVKCVEITYGWRSRAPTK